MIKFRNQFTHTQFVMGGIGIGDWKLFSMKLFTSCKPAYELISLAASNSIAPPNEKKQQQLLTHEFHSDPRLT